MTDVEQARSWSPRVISKFETLIRGDDDLGLYRVNPLAFARDLAIADAEIIDLFLHATRCGLFEMSWEVLCPQSGMVLESFGPLRTRRVNTSRLQAPRDAATQASGTWSLHRSSGSKPRLPEKVLGDLNRSVKYERNGNRF